MQPLPFPIIGRATAVAVFALAHVLFNNLALAGPFIAAVTEWVGMKKGDGFYYRFAQGIAKISVVVFSIGALFGVGLVALLIGLFPDFWSLGVNIFFWPLVMEVVLFLLEGLFLYMYYYTFDRLQGTGGHVAIGALAFLFSSGTMIIINGVGGAMLTPQGLGAAPFDRSFTGLYLANPTWFPLTLHRWFGAISFIGFGAAAIAAYAYGRVQDAERQRFFDWAGGWGVRFALIPLIAMPFIGFLYLNTIAGAAKDAFVALTQGDLRWAFNIQVVLLGLLFVAANFYLARRTQESTARVAPGEMMPWIGLGAVVAVALGAYIAFGVQNQSDIATPTDSTLIPILEVILFAVVAGVFYSQQKGNAIDWVKAARLMTLALGLCFIIGILPYKFGVTIPLGRMRPWRYFAFFGYTGLSIVNVALYYKAKAGIAWGKVDQAARNLLAVGGLAGVTIMMVMGYIRESARSPFLIYNLMKVADETAEKTFPSAVPLPFGLVIVTFIVVAVAYFLLMALALWTAHGGAVAPVAPAAKPAAAGSK